MDDHLVWRKVGIPKGLSSLLGLISKETIIHNPDCVYSFIADLLEQELRERTTKGDLSNERTEETHLLAANGDEEDESGNNSKLSSDFSDQRNFNGSVEGQPSQVSLVNEDDTVGGGAAAAGATDEGKDVEVSKSPAATTTPQSDLQSSLSPTSSPSSPQQPPPQREESAKIVSVSSSSAASGGDGSRPDSAQKSVSPSSPKLATPLKLQADEANDDADQQEEDLSLNEASKSEENIGDADKEEEEEDEEEEEEEDEDLEQQLNTQELADLLASGDFSNVSRSEERQDGDDDGDEDDDADDDVHNDDSSSEELRLAATKIQAGFRGYQARKNLKNKKEKATTESPSDETANNVSPLRGTPTDGVTRRQGSGKIRNSAKYRSGMVITDNNSSPEDLALDDQYLDKAATRIQANVRGFLTRKSIEKNRQVEGDKKNAAVKIQATVRGFLTRRRIAKQRTSNRRRSSLGSTLKAKNSRKSSLKPEAAAAAATKIQALYRGYNVRSKQRKSGASMVE